MSPLDLLSLGFARLRSRPMRAVLSALGISIGIATMVVVIGIPASSQQAVVDELAALGPNLLKAQAVPNQASGEQAGMPAESVTMARRVGPVEQVSAVANVHAAVARTDLGGETGALTTLAATSDLLEVLDGKVRSGTFFNGVNEKFPTVVLGSKAATWLGITEVPEAPPRIRLANKWFTVVGVLDPMPLAPDVERSVLVGWDLAVQELKFDGRPTVVYVRSAEPEIDSVRAVLPRTLDPERPGQVQVSRPSDALAAKRITQNAFGTLLLGLAGVALLVGGIGVANTMVISVLERRREIGLRRALGAGRRQIRWQFLVESVVLCVLGGVSGGALGLVATAGYAHVQNWPVVIPATAILAGLGASVTIGVLAGVYPAVRASSLTPTEALAST
jgi:putative ABC transport system permease protein